MARYSRAYPGVELTVICEPSVDLLRADRRQRSRSCDHHHLRQPAAVRDVPAGTAALGHVGPPRHASGEPAAARARPAELRLAADRARMPGERRSSAPDLFTSSNAGAVAAAVLAGLAVSVLPESGLRPGMRVLDPRRRFPGIALLPHRPRAQSARELAARGRARRARRLVARQPVGSGAGGGVDSAASGFLRRAQHQQIAGEHGDEADDAGNVQR